MKERYNYIIIGLSVLIMIGSIFVADAGLSRTVESLGVILDANKINQNPKYLDAEIESLEKKNQAIEARLKRLEVLKEPTLDLLNGVAGDNYVKITGINRKTDILKKYTSESQIELVFTGRITNVLNCLDNIESNFILKIDRLWMQQNSDDENLVDLYLLIVLPEGRSDDI